MKFLDRILIKVFVFQRSLCGFRPHNRVNKVHQIEEFLYVVVQRCLCKNELHSNVYRRISLTPVIRIRCPTFRVLSSWKSFESSFFTEHTLRKVTGRGIIMLTSLALINDENLPTAWPIEDGGPALITSSVERLVRGKKNVKLELGESRYSLVVKEFVSPHDFPGGQLSVIRNHANLGCPGLKLASPIHNCRVGNNDQGRESAMLECDASEQCHDLYRLALQGSSIKIHSRSDLIHIQGPVKCRPQLAARYADD